MFDVIAVLTAAATGVAAAAAADMHIPFGLRKQNMWEHIQTELFICIMYSHQYLLPPLPFRTSTAHFGQMNEVNLVPDLLIQHSM